MSERETDITERTPARAHWSDLAPHWDWWGPPLRPTPEDLAAMQDFIGRADRPVAVSTSGGGGGRGRALLWGVTPEIATMAFPAGMELLAVDKSQAMIRHVWPGNVVGRRSAVCADWFDHPEAGGQFNVVIGDGAFAIVGYPDGYRALAAEAHRVLRAGGILVTRLFLRPGACETAEAVLATLRHGGFGNFHFFKIRLAMAMQGNVRAGVRMGDVYDAWARAGIDTAALAAARGWSGESIRTIDYFRDRDTRLTFPSLAEFDAAVGEFFTRIDCRVPGYEMGECFPTVCCGRRG